MVQRVIGCFAATKGALMLADDLSILPAFQSICVSTDLNRTTDGTGIDGVTVVIEPDQAGLGYRCRDCVESIKGAYVRDQT